MFREAFVTKVELGRSRLFLSLLLHCLLVLVVPNLWLILPGSEAEQTSAFYRRRAIVYRMPLMAPTKMLPRVAPVGPGGRPGSGSEGDRPPALGRIGSAGRWTLIYKPVHPDNFRQTIRQLDSPPDLKIRQEIKAPDIIFGNLHEPERPILHLEVKNAKPIVGIRQAGSEAVPAPDLAVSITSPMTILQLVNDHPHLPVQALAASKPVLKPGTDESGFSAPDDAGFPGTGNGLVVLSVNPGWSTAQPALPSGNREGEFAISPGGGRNGSPGGASDGVVGGGSGNSGGNGGKTGGDGSTGPGPGNEGGGGGRSADTGSLTINGTRGAVESVGVLRSNFIASLVYPVERALLPPRKGQLVVSAGPIGGGGLNVYGALHCGKIYTIFLEMPRKNWTLQFCQHGEGKENTTTQNRSAIVHLEEGIVAPYPEAKFDFRRLPVAEKDSRKLIVLKGILKEDGTADKLEVYQGLLSEMDEAARLALSRWKFKPATRAKVPVAVDILVGIPAQVPRAH
jgi:TonB-like protein